MTATFQKTTVGLNYIRDAMIGANGSNGMATYVSLGIGAAVTTGAINSGTPYTSIPVASLAAAIAPSQSLTLIDTTGDTQVVTVTGAGAALHATSIPTVSFTPTSTFAIGSGLVNTPALADTGLEDETFRNTVTTGAAGGTGESLIILYVGPSDIGSNTNFFEAGLWGGPDASGTLGSGILFGRCVCYFAFTNGVTASNLEFDLTLS